MIDKTYVPPNEGTLLGQLEVFIAAYSKAKLEKAEAEARVNIIKRELDALLEDLSKFGVKK